MEIRTQGIEVTVFEESSVYIEGRGLDVGATWEELDERVTPRITYLTIRIEELTEELAAVLRLAVSPPLEDAA